MKWIIEPGFGIGYERLNSSPLPLNTAVFYIPLLLQSLPPLIITLRNAIFDHIVKAGFSLPARKSTHPKAEKTVIIYKHRAVCTHVQGSRDGTISSLSRPDSALMEKIP